MRKIIIASAMLVMTACAPAKQTSYQNKISAFKKMTKDICVENPHEVRLAQNLYLQIFNNK
jgi:hypothetical protein